MAKADKALAARRVEEVLRIRLDGAEFWDVREFVREKEREAGSAWCLDEGESPLSDSQIRRYQQQADARVMESIERSRRKLFRQHLAKRRNLYARAVTTGDPDRPGLPAGRGPAPPALRAPASQAPRAGPRDGRAEAA